MNTIAVDTKEQKRVRTEQTALVLEDVAAGENIFASITQRNLSEHVTAVVREGVRSGQKDINVQIAKNLTLRPLAERVAYSIDCFSHALHTRQNDDICSFWRDILIDLAPKTNSSEVKNSLLNGLKVCAITGNTNVGNNLFFTLLTGNSKHTPNEEEILKFYFTNSLDDANSIKNVCALQQQMKTAQYNTAMEFFLNQLNKTLKEKPSQIGRKQFISLVHNVPKQYADRFQRIVWQRCLNWCMPPNTYSYGKISIDYMLHYASQHGNRECWETLGKTIQANYLGNMNVPAVNTALDLVQRMMLTSSLMDQYATVVRTELRSLFASVATPELKGYGVKETWERVHEVYNALEKSELLQHIGHTHDSVSEKSKRKM